MQLRTIHPRRGFDDVFAAASAWRVLAGSVLLLALVLVLALLVVSDWRRKR